MTYALDSVDKQILKMVVEDARVPFLEVARVCNLSGAAIHQRIQKLTSLGVIKGSHFIVDAEKIGFHTCAFIGLYLRTPENFESVIKELKKMPEVVECHFTTGVYDLFIKVYAHNNDELLNFVHDKLLPLGLARTETLISLQAFDRQLPIQEE